MEQWKDIKFTRNGSKYDFTGYYKISDRGNVKSLDRHIVRKDGVIVFIKGVTLKQHKNTKGYLVVSLSTGNKPITVFVHRLMLFAFISNPGNKPQGNHKDGIKTNNFVYNLEWCTNSENQLHCNKLGLRNTKHSTETKNKISESLLKLGRDRIEKIEKQVTMFQYITKEEIQNFKSIKTAVTWLKNNGYPKANSSAISNACRKIRGFYKGNCYGHHWEFTQAPIYVVERNNNE